MITKAGKAIQKMALLSVGSRIYGIEAKSTTGATRYITRVYDSANVAPSVFIYYLQGYGMAVGSGDTPPTENDYSLEQIITTGLTSVSFTVISAQGLDDSGNIQHVITAVLRNTSSEDIVIREVGTQVRCYSSYPNGSGNNASHYFLIDRTLLDNPVTIAPNDTGMIQYTIKMLNDE